MSFSKLESGIHKLLNFNAMQEKQYNVTAA